MTNSTQSANGPAGRFLSKEECVALAQRTRGMASGGGKTHLRLESSWTGMTAWARNRIKNSSDLRDNNVSVIRVINGAGSSVNINEVSDKHLDAAVRRAERILQQGEEHPEAEFYAPYIEPFKEPNLWFEKTYQLQADARSEIARNLIKPAETAGMLAAGNIAVSARGRAVLNQDSTPLYYPYTLAFYSVTVRDPQGSASGWAGSSWNDWGRVDPEKVSAIALEKCLSSRNAVAIEPGRYDAILEPQAVADMVGMIVGSLDREANENWDYSSRGPFSGDESPYSKIGLEVVDKRITIGHDYMDPDLGFPPYDLNGNVFNSVNWIQDGVLKELAYPRESYAIRQLGKNNGLPNPGAYRMSGGTSTIQDMITHTKRGILVTRFSDIENIDRESLLSTGLTRDGLWLVENGKISKPIKNFRFTESPLIILNSILELGVPQRVYSATPTIVPALRVQDFSFTSLADAV